MDFLPIIYCIPPEDSIRLYIRNEQIFNYIVLLHFQSENVFQCSRNKKFKIRILKINDVVPNEEKLNIEIYNDRVWMGRPS